jgi:hypothetical protein
MTFQKNTTPYARTMYHIIVTSSSMLNSDPQISLAISINMWYI